jgi:hypothetical protein
MRRCGVLLLALGVATAAGCSKNNPVQSTTCNYTLSSATQSAAAEGGSASINVTRTSDGACGWTAQSDASWITLSNPSASDTAALGFSVSANMTTESRTGHVTVSWTGGTSQLTLTQAGRTTPASCTYSVDPVGITAPAEGSSGQATVTVAGTNCNWTAQSNQFWIHITSATSGPNTGTIAYTVDPNTGAQRFGRIIVTHTAGTTDIGFTQNAPCSASLNPTTQSVNNAGGSFSTAFTTAGGCAWTAASDAAWLTISSATSGTGDATISYAVAANSGAPRTGHITVTVGGTSAQLTVNQGVLTASFTVSTSPCNVAANGPPATANQLSCTFDARGSTGDGINSYVFRLENPQTGPVLASGTNPVVTDPTLTCGQGGLAGAMNTNVTVNVYLTITSLAGSSTAVNSVVFRRTNTTC